MVLILIPRFALMLAAHVIRIEAVRELCRNDAVQCQSR